MQRGIYQVYTQQQGKSNQKKKEFYQNLQNLVDQHPATMLVKGNMNGHVGNDRDGLGGLGALGMGNRNREGEHVIVFLYIKPPLNHE